jgi:hypothetical protein
MVKRLVSTTLLSFALLFGQAGIFLIAALCPHLAPGMTSCEGQGSTAPMAHDETGHMDHMAMNDPPPWSEADSAALGQPVGKCSHCAVHSRTSPDPASLRQTEAPKRSAELNTPLHISRVAPPALPPLPLLTSRAHGPPGEGVPRHLLVNIFRI